MQRREKKSLPLRHNFVVGHYPLPLFARYAKLFVQFSIENAVSLTVARFTCASLVESKSSLGEVRIYYGKLCLRLYIAHGPVANTVGMTGSQRDDSFAFIVFLARENDEIDTAER